MHLQPMIVYQLLVEWINCSSYRDERLFLQQHRELVDLQAITLLQEQTRTAPEHPAIRRVLQVHRHLLEDALSRGGNETAIDDVYLDFFGGFVLGEPEWLRELEHQLLEHIDVASAKGQQPPYEFWRSWRSIAAADLHCPKAVHAEIALRTWESVTPLLRMMPVEEEDAEIAYLEHVLAEVMLLGLPRQLARVKAHLGNAFTSRRAGKRDENIDQALVFYAEAIEQIDPESMPILWSWVCHNAGSACLLRGSTESWDTAITYFRQALRTRSAETEPREWGTTCKELGKALVKRGMEGHPEDIRHGLTYLDQALTIFTPTETLLPWVDAMMMRGVALTHQVEQSEQSIAEAITIFENVFVHLLPEHSPPDWFLAHYHYSVALFKYRGPQRHAYLERARESIEAALTISLDVISAHDWASAQAHMGAIYLDRMAGDARENISLARKALLTALCVFDRTHYPMEWAAIKHNLGQCFLREGFERRDQAHEKAISRFKAALTVRTSEAAPLERARTLVHLGTAWQDRLRGSRIDNFREALSCFEAARALLTAQQRDEWIHLHLNWGIAYLHVPGAVQSGNIERGIALLQAIQGMIETSVDADLRFRYAINLAQAWEERQQGQTEENFQQASHWYEQALQFLHHEERAIERARAYVSRGAMRMQWGRIVEQELRDAHDYYQAALQDLRDALQICSATTYPHEWAMIQNGLGSAYALLREEGWYEKAKDAFAATLEYWTPDLYPFEARNSLMNLAELVFTVFWQKDRGIMDAYGTRVMLETAHEALSQARKIQSELGWLEYDLQGYAALRGETPHTANIYARDAWCLWALGDIRQAIVALEEGRAQALAETQTIAMTPQEGLCPIHNPQFIQARDAWMQVKRELEPVLSPEQRARIRAARANLRRVRQEIRLCSQCQGALLLTTEITYSDLQAIAPEHAVLYLAAGEIAGFAAIIPPRNSETTEREPVAVGLPRLTEQRVSAWIRAPYSHGGFASIVSYTGARLIEQWLASAGSAFAAIPLRDLTQYMDGDWKPLRTALTQIIEQKPSDGSAVKLPDGEPLSSAVNTRTGLWLQHPQRRTWLDRQLFPLLQQMALDWLLAECRMTMMDVVATTLRDNQWLRTDQIVDIIPCGEVSLLPLHAVPVDDQQTPFMETCLCSFLPNLRALQFALLKHRQYQQKLGAMVIVGNPGRDDHEANLPYAELEVAGIIRSWRTQVAHIDSMIGAKATLGRLRQALEQLRTSQGHMPNWIHIAGHGSASVVSPDHCYMLLSGYASNGQRERLTLSMLMKEPLLQGVDTVVASGCSTAMNDLYIVPDELGSFASGLIQAGATRVLATQWPVRDSVICLLMLRFYDEFLTKRSLAPLIALREACRWLRKATRSQILEFAQAWQVPLKAANEDLRDHFRGIDDEMAEADESNALSEELAPFSHASYWASVIHVGVVEPS